MGKTTIPHTCSKNRHRTRYAMAKQQSAQKVMWEKRVTALFLLAQCQLARTHRTHSLSLFVNYFFPLCGYRKYPYTNCRWLLYIPSGTGMSKAMEETMNRNVHRGGRGAAQTKKPSLCGVWLFSRTTQGKLVNSYQLIWTASIVYHQLIINGPYHLKLAVIHRCSKGYWPSFF